MPLTNCVGQYHQYQWNLSSSHCEAHPLDACTPFTFHPEKGQVWTGKICCWQQCHSHIYSHQLRTLCLQSSGAVWKSRCTSWSNTPTNSAYSYWVKGRGGGTSVQYHHYLAMPVVVPFSLPIIIQPWYPAFWVFAKKQQRSRAFYFMEWNRGPICSESRNNFICCMNSCSQRLQQA